MYKIKIEQFEGPLDLLLEIVESRKLNLVEVSLAEVAEQFLQYLENVKEESLREISQFLTVGSRLVLLKSRELVPVLNDELEADGEIGTLKEQLQRYQPFRQAAKFLGARLREGKRYHSRAAFADKDPIFYFPKGLDAQTLAKVAQVVAESAVAAQKIPQATVKPMFSVDECVRTLRKEAKGGKEFNFSTFVAQQEQNRRVVHFVGMLELVRTGKMSAAQKNNFGTIILTSHE